MLAARRLVFLAFLLWPAAGLLADPPPDKAPVTFSPDLWRFGEINQGQKAATAVTARNVLDRPVVVSLIPTCDCLSAAPSRVTIPAGGQASFRLEYDSADDVGNTRKDFLVRTDPPASGPLYYTARGTVRAEGGQAARAQGSWAIGGSISGSRQPTVTVLYYYNPGCRSCEEFLSVEVPRLERQLGLKIALFGRDLLDPANYRELSDFAAARGQTLRAFPVLRIGEELLQGDREINDRAAFSLKELAIGSRTPSPAPTPVPPGTTASPAISVRVALLPVLAAGLLDGINPCAFTTLIFLLASLALAGRGRREVLVIGSLFSLAVLLTYLGIGLGFLSALRAAGSVAVVSLVLRWALAAALVVFAGLSFYDYLLIRRGRPTQIVLQLPAAVKRQIHRSIRTRVRTAALAGSSLSLGFLVSLFEFACTGQVYLPTLAFLARVGRNPEALGLLAAYNLSFIAPLLVVFGASYLGVSSRRITSFFQSHMARIKLALAVLFVGLAVLTLAA